MSAKQSPLDVIEVGYDMSGSTGDWLRRVATSVYDQLGVGLGMQTYTYDITSEDQLRLRDVHVVDLPDASREPMRASMEQLPPEFVRGSFMRCEAITQSQVDAPTRALVAPVMRELEAAFGWRDLWILGGMNPTRSGVYLGTALPQPTKLPKGTIRDWTRVAVHLAAAYRLRRRFEGVEKAAALQADAIVTPNGSIKHLESDARIAGARDEIVAAVKETEKARGPLRHREPAEAIELWRGLVSSRWTLVDHFENDGQRYVLARRNDLSLGGLAGLSDRERQVLGYAALGHTNKLIAYDMGLSASTVRVLLHRAGKKLRVKTRTEMIAAYNARGTT